MIDLYFLIPAVTSQIFHVIVELAINKGTPTDEANTEIETHPLISETKNKKNAKSNSKPYTIFYAFQSLNHYVLLLLKDNFLFNLFFQSKFFIAACWSKKLIFFIETRIAEKVIAMLALVFLVCLSQFFNSHKKRNTF